MNSGQEPKTCQVPVGLHRNSSQIFQNTNRKNNIRFFIHFKFKFNDKFEMTVSPPTEIERSMPQRSAGRGYNPGSKKMPHFHKTARRGKNRQTSERPTTFVDRTGRERPVEKFKSPDP